MQNKTFNQALLEANWVLAKDIIDEEPDSEVRAVYIKQISDLLKNAIEKEEWQNVFAMKQAFKKGSYLPVAGPSPKSKATFLLEELTRRLIVDGDFTVSIDEHGNDMLTFRDGARYNWTEILREANFKHILLTEADDVLFLTYKAAILKGLPEDERKQSLDPEYKQDYVKALYKHYTETNQELPAPQDQITFSEMEALNRYTGNFHLKMHKVLKKQAPLNQLSPVDIRSTIINSVQCASGLSKIPVVSIDRTVRFAEMDSSEQQHARVTAAASGSKIVLDGFVSTSTTDNWYIGRPIKYHFTNIKGAYIASISQMPTENEFLILPTEIQLFDFKEENVLGKVQYHFYGNYITDVGYLHETEFDKVLANLKQVVQQFAPSPEQQKVAQKLYDELWQYKENYFTFSGINKDEFEEKSITAINRAVGQLGTSNLLNVFYNSTIAAFNKVSYTLFGKNILAETAVKKLDLEANKFKSRLTELKNEEDEPPSLQL